MTILFNGDLMKVVRTGSTNGPTFDKLHSRNAKRKFVYKCSVLQRTLLSIIRGFSDTKDFVVLSKLDVNKRAEMSSEVDVSMEVAILLSSKT